ncbi:MAG: Gfo/Idh/MocA family oxidoreductase [Clostridia bacterium]|nr:Gfo/Idh/MocA family oxidoreductase [Clostridia bacterium]
MEKKVIKYGLVGFGKQGSFYAKVIFNKFSFLNPDAKLAAICDIDEKRLEEAKRLYPKIPTFTDYKEMFKSGLIDVVMVETPHYIHPTIVIDAFNSGLNVLCDKPAGVYTKQVREMNEEAEKHPELLFGLMFNQRTNPLYIKAKELIDSNRLGKLTRIVWIITDWYRPDAYYNQGGWRGTWNGEGGGVLINQCPHQLDLFTWLAGLPVSVTATAKTVGRNIAVENDVSAVCEFANGATGVFITSTHDAPGTNRLEITGEGGKIVIENDTLVFTENEQMESEFSKTNTVFMGKPKTKVTKMNGYIGYLKNLKKQPPQHVGIVRNYTDFLLKKTDKFIAPGKEGIIGLTFSNAIHLSAWTHKTVTLPLDEEEFIKELEKRKEEENKNNLGI